MKKLLSTLPYFAGIGLSLLGMAFAITGKCGTTTAGEIATFSLSFLIGAISVMGIILTVKEAIQERKKC